MKKILLLLVFIAGSVTIFANSNNAPKTDSNSSVKVKYIDSEQMKERIKDYNITDGGEG